jgi:NitT/TauT family transport system ATP-binding protein
MDGPDGRLVTAGVSLRRVSKTYFARDGAEVPALVNVDFEVAPGEFVSLLGPSGCGKTTCVRIVDGVEEPDPGGLVEVAGRRVAGPGYDRARVFQHFAVLPWKTVQENVELGLKWKGVDKAARARAAERLIARVGLDGFARRYPRELSGGMRQRVGIARALALDPQVLLADEPFGSVDAFTREILQEELLRVWSGTGTTILFVTHSIDEAIYLSDRVLVMSARPGRIVDTIDVPLPRPRVHEMRETPAFGAMRRRIWERLTEGRTGIA